MVEYYDKILVGIGASVLGGVVLGLVTTIGFQSGVVLGGVVATFFMYDAMIRNPPLPPADPRVAATAIVWHVALLVLVLT